MFYALKKSLQSKPSSQEIQKNILSGLTVGIIALPLSMALAIASGVPPQYGLYTAIIAGVFIALTGGSKVNISGPTAAFVVILLPIVHQYGLGGLLLSGFMAGIILILMGVGKLGKLIEIVPYPVVIGFTAGIGMVIATFQIKDFFGLDITSSEGDYFEKVFHIIQAFPTLHWQETFIGVLTLSILIIWPKFRSKIPGHIIALLVGSLVAWLLSHFVPGFSVETVGSRFSFELDGVIGHGIPPIPPMFEWPWNLPGADGKPLGLSFDLIQELLPAAITIAILGSLESLLCAVVADGMSGKKHNSNDELIGQGIGNIIAPLFGGIPATAAIARTAANIKSGGTLPLSSVVHSLFILLSILLIAPILSYIPMAAMAALLLVVAWNMSEAKHFVRTLKVAPRDDIFILLSCFSLTVIFDMTVAVSIGMALAAVLFIKRTIDLTDNSVIEHDHTGQSLPDNIVIYDIDGPLFFGSAQKALKTIAVVRPEVNIIILDMTEVGLMDMSAMMAMKEIQSDLQTKNIALIIHGLHPRITEKLQRVNICSEPGKLVFTQTLEESLHIAKNELNTATE